MSRSEQGRTGGEFKSLSAAEEGIGLCSMKNLGKVSMPPDED